MNLTHVPKIGPFDGTTHCLLSGGVSDERGFLRFKTACEGLRGDVHHHISVSALLKEIGMHPELGLASAEEVKQLTAECRLLAERVAELEEENNELARERDAIDLLESAGFRARKKPGPKKPKETP